METVRHRKGPVDIDFAGEVDIAAQYPVPWRADGIGVEMYHLPHPVNPGIGAPGANHPDIPIGHPGNRPLNLELNGIQVFLDLPAMEGRTVVFHSQRPSHSSLPRRLSTACPGTVTAGKRQSGSSVVLSVQAHHHLFGHNSLLLIPFLQHLAEDTACAFLVLHIHVGACEIKLGIHFIQEGLIY